MNKKTHYLIGWGAGLAIGITIGISLSNPLLGIGVGIALGAALGEAPKKDSEGEEKLKNNIWKICGIKFHQMLEESW